MYMSVEVDGIVDVFNLSILDEIRISKYISTIESLKGMVIQVMCEIYFEKRKNIRECA